MTYCRYCGREIAYKHTKNDHWMPCDLLTGEKHFCNENANTAKSGLSVCGKCGKPIFENNGKTIDYATLLPHECKKGDVTRYTKYKDTSAKKNAIEKKLRPNTGGKTLGEEIKPTTKRKRKTVAPKPTGTKRTTTKKKNYTKTKQGGNT